MRSRVLHLAAHQLGRCLAAWRRSLLTRVVLTTVVVSGVVVALLAQLLLRQVGTGLVSAKTRVALVEAQSGVARAQDTIAAGTAGSPQALEARLQEVAQALAQRGQSGAQFAVLFVPSSEDAKSFAAGASLRDVPARLRARLATGTPTAYVYERVHGHATLVVGATLTTDLGPYQLYHLFPLTAEEQTLALVRRTAEGAGLLLVLLLALLVGLVTRQVVLPVRLAALTAERLASGRLEERMAVRGEDEIARLASSFNSMAAALQTQIRQLEDLSRVQRRFVSDVSHELRTPLTTVRMAADLLHERRSELDPPAARSAELLQKELDRFEEMLIDLLEISRYDAGAASLDPERQDLVPLVHRVVDATRPLAERRGSTIDVHSRGPVVAEVDHVRVERIVRNLLVNAVEHGEGGPVEVTVADGHGGVAVLVRDHGVGLAPGQAALVFTRFWRGDPSRARATGGSGLGLAIALEDARLHGGTLQAWGAPGRGAAFRLTLPHTVGGDMGDSPLSLRPEVTA